MSYCKSFLQETLQAVHNFSADTFNIALYTSAAAFDQNTTTYSATNEIPNGGGYTTGGVALVPAVGYPQFEGGGWAVRFQDVQWVFTLTKPDVRYVLIYNTSKANRGIISIDMGTSYTILGTFNWRFPLTAPPIVWQRAPGIV